jgi:lipopolysaccharide export system permease protein
MRRLLDTYIIRQLAATSTLIALTLAGILLMTQSLRFLELIIDSGASGLAFLTLSLLALPRFFEIILPIALAAGTMFVYLRLAKDGEINVMQASGMTPFAITRPGLQFALGVMVILFVTMAWIAPMTLAHMNQLRQLIRTEYSSLLVREGVFNSAGPDVTLYVAKRSADGGLEGLMIYDARPQNPVPVFVLARQGQLVATDRGQQVVVYNGSRQIFNANTQGVERLNFERYIIDLPDQGGMQQRWAEPEERTIYGLLYPRADDAEAFSKAKQYDFFIELHRRIASPMLAPCFYLVTMAFLLLMPFARTRRGWDIAWAAAILLILQSSYLGALSFARQNSVGLVLMYGVVLVPMIIAGVLLLRASRVTVREEAIA